MVARAEHNVPTLGAGVRRRSRAIAAVAGVAATIALWSTLSAGLVRSPASASVARVDGWHTPTVVTHRLNFAYDVAMSSYGRAVIAWYAGRGRLMARIRTPETGWARERV